MRLAIEKKRVSNLFSVGKVDANFKERWIFIAFLLNFFGFFKKMFVFFLQNLLNLQKLSEWEWEGERERKTHKGLSRELTVNIFYNFFFLLKIFAIASQFNDVQYHHLESQFLEFNLNFYDIHVSVTQNFLSRWYNFS